MSEKRIEKEWETFSAACFGPGLGKQQRLDLKRTFYGGAAAWILMMSKSPVGETDESLLAEILIELGEFNEDVKAGRA